MPTYSVVMPVHNKARHVGRTVDSVLAQRFTDFELIAVDDASTDGSRARLETFRDPRFRILARDEPSSGGYAARNLAIREARAAWIAFLDADDWWDAGFLAAVEQARTGLPEAVGCFSTGFRVEGGPPMAAQRAIRPDALGRLPPVDFSTFLDLWGRMGDCPVWTSALVIRRDLLLQAGGFPEHRCRRGGDKDTWLRVMRLTCLQHVPADLAVYHRDAVNMTTRTVPFRGRHCVEATLEDLLRSTQDRELRRRLIGVLNCEIWSQFREALRRGDPRAIDPSGFVAMADPLRFAIVRLVLLAPDRLRDATWSLVRRLRRDAAGSPAGIGARRG